MKAVKRWLSNLLQPPYPDQRRRFVAYFYFVDWDEISLGLNVCLLNPTLDIHLPFGFVRIGWAWKFKPGTVVYGAKEASRRTFGYEQA